MAITINWGTFVINVPRNDMLLIQSSPTEVRELNINNFRLSLKDLEDDEAGIVFPKTHDHNPSVTVSGVQLARVVEILDPYTITFEDGQYAVNLVGANSNIADKTNVNQVSVRSANSAGLIQTREIEYSSFQNRVSIDVVNGVAGTDYPIGTAVLPSNNYTDAKFIAELRGLNTFYLLSDSTLTDGINLNDFIFEGRSKLSSTLTIDPSASVTNCTFQSVTIQGTLDSNCFIRDSIIENLSGVEGDIHGCEIEGIVTLSGSAGLEIWNSYSGRRGAADPGVIDMGGGGTNCAIHNFSGHIKIRNMSTYGIVGVSTSSGANVTIESTVSAGMVHLIGNLKLVNNSTGTTNVITDYITSQKYMSNRIWSETSRTLTSGTKDTEIDGLVASVAALPTLSEIEASSVLAKESTSALIKAKTDGLPGGIAKIRNLITLNLS